MSQKDTSRWELRLGLFQVVILLGLTMGLLTCTFFLGYFSGRQVGQDAALSANLSSTIRLPIDATDQAERIDEGESQRVASEVYAKLNDNNIEKQPGTDGKTQADDVPKLGAIDSTDVAPIDNIPQEDVAAGQKGAAEKSQPTADTAEAAMTVEPTNVSREQLLKQVIALEESKPKEKESDDLPVKEKAAAAQKTVVVPTPLPTIKPTETVAKVTPTKIAPTPKPTKTPKATAKAEKGEVVQKGWFAQVAAPKKKEDATELSRQLRKSGFSVIVEVAQVKGQQYYRILAGPESSKEQAEKLVDQLKREPYIPTKPFIRQIK